MGRNALGFRPTARFEPPKDTAHAPAASAVMHKVQQDLVKRARQPPMDVAIMDGAPADIGHTPCCHGHDHGNVRCRDRRKRHGNLW